MAKNFGYNLLTFVYFADQHRGVAKLVLKKSTCQHLIKVYQKYKYLPLSDKVKVLSNLLNSNAVCKISALDQATIPANLIDEIVFVLLEQWPLFVQWTKVITTGLIITVSKSIETGIDWVASENSFSQLTTNYTIKSHELGMNTIIFNNGFAYESDGFKYQTNGIAKIILTPSLWANINKLDNILAISQYLSNESIFCHLCLEPNSSNILAYAFTAFASLISSQKAYINAAFARFTMGVVLELVAVVHEQFQLQQISGMKITSNELK